MANDIRERAQAWAEIIADAYADAARPVVTSGARAYYAAELTPPLEQVIAIEGPGSVWGRGFVNPILDKIELRDGIRGPRLKTIDHEPNRAIMAFDGN